MKNIYGFLVLFTVLLLMSVAKSEDGGLTISAAVNEGLSEPPTLKKYTSAREEAAWGKTLGLSALVPHVDLKIDHSFNTEYRTVPVILGGTTVAIPSVYPKTSYGAEARWTVFDGLANLRTYQASQKISEAAEQEESRKAFEVRKRIELAFYNALAAKRFAEVAEENVKTLEESRTQVANRLRGGVSTEYDVLRVEVQLSDAKTDLERAQDTVAIERRSLAEAMGRAEDDRPLAGVLPTPGELERIQGIKAPDLSARQDFQAARLRSEAALKQASAANGGLLQAVGLLAQYEKYENTDYPGEAYGGYRNAWNVGVFMRWSLFDGGATFAKAGMARAGAARAGHAYAETVLSLPRF